LDGVNDGVRLFVWLGEEVNVKVREAVHVGVLERVGLLVREAVEVRVNVGV
jgi:hypothetical protein